MPPKTSPTRIDGTALAVIRQKDGHTQASLAAACGYSNSYIGDLENGYRHGNPTVLKRLSTALNVPPYMLLARRADAA